MSSVDPLERSLREANGASVLGVLLQTSFFSGLLLPWTEISFIEELLEHTFGCNFIQQGCSSFSPRLHHSVSQIQHIGTAGATEMASNKSHFVYKLSTAVASLLFFHAHHYPCHQCLCAYFTASHWGPSPSAKAPQWDRNNLAAGAVLAELGSETTQYLLANN